MHKTLQLLVVLLCAIRVETQVRQEDVNASVRFSVPHSMLVDLPLTPESLGGAVGKIAFRQRVHVGIELTPQAPSRDERLDGLQLDLEGLALSDALDLLLRYDSRYAWRVAESGVTIVRPRAFINNREDFLNRSFGPFDADDITISEALTLVHQHFDRAFRQPPPLRPELLARNAHVEPERARDVIAGVRKCFSVHVRNGTVRQVLDAIVKAHGEALWVITYRQLPPEYRNAHISFKGFANWGIGAAAQSHVSGR